VSAKSNFFQKIN